jgi:hypothetical protein
MAKIYISISEYTPWSGAVETFDTIVEEDMLESLDALLEDIFPDGLSTSELNDLLWFDSEMVLGALGLAEPEDDEDEEDDEDKEDDFEFEDDDVLSSDFVDSDLDD